MPLAPSLSMHMTSTAIAREISLYIGMKDVTDLADLGTVSIQDNAGNDRSTANLTLWSGLAALPEVYDQAQLRMHDNVLSTDVFRGFVRSRHPITGLEPLLEVIADDIGGLLDDIWIDVEYRQPESMQARIAYFWGKYAGAHLSGDLSQVASIGGTLPSQRYETVTLRQVLEMILAQASSTAKYHVDSLGRPHVYTAESNAAPYNVVVGTPAGGEIAPEDLDVDYDSNVYYNRALVKYATGSVPVKDDAAIAAANGLVRTALLQAPEAVTAAQAEAVGNLYLARQKAGIARGSFSASSPYDGWRSGQLLNVTEPDIGLTAQQFQIRSVTQTFEADKTDYRRKYRVEFGGRTAGLQGEGQAPTIAGTSGSLILLDQLGNSMLSNAAASDSGGLGPTHRRYVMSGVYNGDFYAPPPGPDAPISSTNPLPYWSWVNVSGTAVTALSQGDSTIASGHKLTFTMIAGAAADEGYLEQIAPVNGSLGQSYIYLPHLTVRTPAAVNNVQVYISAQYLKVDGSTTGASGTDSRTLAAIGANTVIDLFARANANGIVPSDAYYLRIRIGMKRGAAANGDTASCEFSEARCQWGVRNLFVPEDTLPGSYGYFNVYQQNGILYMQANTAGASGLFPDIRLDATNGKLILNAGSAGTNLVELWGPMVSGRSVSAAITGNTDNWNPTDLHRAMWLRPNPNAAWNLTGINAGSTGEMHYLSNVSGTGGNNLTLVHQSAASAVGARFNGPNNANVVLRPQGSVWLIYDNDWRIEGA